MMQTLTYQLVIKIDFKSFAHPQNDLDAKFQDDKRCFKDEVTILNKYNCNFTLEI